MGTIVWTPLIIDDLKSIHTYIALESIVYANRTIGKIISRVNQLQRFPESGKIVPEFGQKSIRDLTEENYRIVYKIHPEHIGIVRVQHAARILRSIRSEE